MPRLTSYLGLLREGVNKLVERNIEFTTSPIPTKGIDYINSLITRADIRYILKADNDVDRLSRAYKEYSGPAYSDFIRQYSVKNRAFIYSEIMDTAEYLLITEDFDIVDKIPFGVDNIDIWIDNVRPLTMLSNPSYEIQLNNVASRLKYRKEPPVEAVFSINVIKLLMLYSKYRILKSKEFINNVDNYPFIYRTCILPMLRDNTKVWLLHIVRSMILGYLSIDNYSFNIQSITYGEKSTFINGGLSQAIHDIEDIIKKCMNKQMKPDEVLLSIYTSEDTSIFDDMISLMDNHYVGTGGIQYEWSEFIREYQLLTILLGIYELYGESTRFTELSRLFKIIARRSKNTKFWQHIRNPFVADDMANKFEELCIMYNVD
jgi:hypothetical protein